jgi:hypothetical protein
MNVQYKANVANFRLVLVRVHMRNIHWLVMRHGKRS